MFSSKDNKNIFNAYSLILEQDQNRIQELKNRINNDPNLTPQQKAEYLKKLGNTSQPQTSPSIPLSTNSIEVDDPELNPNQDITNMGYAETWGKARTASQNYYDLVKQKADPNTIAQAKKLMDFWTNVDREKQQEVKDEYQQTKNAPTKTTSSQGFIPSSNTPLGSATSTSRTTPGGAARSTEEKGSNPWVTQINPYDTMSKDRKYFTYTVRSGDNGTLISSRTGLNEKDPAGMGLQAANPNIQIFGRPQAGRKPMKVGDVLKIPVELSSLVK